MVFATTKYGVALYSESKWCFKILGETDTAYICEHFDADKPHFVDTEGGRWTLRKSLFTPLNANPKTLYAIIDHTSKYLKRYKLDQENQYTIFDFIGD